MTLEYEKYFEELEKSDDLSSKKEKTINFLKYLINYGEENIDKKFIYDFCVKSLELLPGRSEPRICMEKYGISFTKRRKVSFNHDDTEYWTIDRKFYSKEGKRQAVREDKKLNLTNLDPSKKFKPVSNIEKLPTNTTIVISNFDDIGNCFKMELSDKPKVLGTLEYSVDDIILNPSLLDNLI